MSLTNNMNYLYKLTQETDARRCREEFYGKAEDCASYFKKYEDSKHLDTIMEYGFESMDEFREGLDKMWKDDMEDLDYNKIKPVVLLLLNEMKEKEEATPDIELYNYTL